MWAKKTDIIGIYNRYIQAYKSKQNDNVKTKKNPQNQTL